MGRALRPQASAARPRGRRRRPVRSSSASSASKRRPVGVSSVRARGADQAWQTARLVPMSQLDAPMFRKAALELPPRRRNK